MSKFFDTEVKRLLKNMSDNQETYIAVGYTTMYRGFITKHKSGQYKIYDNYFKQVIIFCIENVISIEINQGIQFIRVKEISYEL